MGSTYGRPNRDKMTGRCPANPLGSVLATRELMNGTYAERLAVATFSERPDLLGRVFDPEIQSAVPEFMRHDPAGALYYGDGILDGYREYGLDPAEPDRPVARAFSVPFAFCNGTAGRDDCPTAGGTR